ncbi:MAG: hypothetical protein FWF86_01485 [Clostridia bacterium]|nr:hypothetical protein [Clostridia bacterium]
MPEYILSVDGGGTKTEFCLSSFATGESRHFLSGSTNYKIGEADAERSVILESVRNVFREMGITAARIRGMVMGMSGVDSPEDHDHYMNIALSTGIPKERIYVCNDSELAFYAKGTPPGLCIVAGTGSVATGIAADQRKARSGGWSNFISDEGSGSWIGTQVLRALLQCCDGYGAYHEVFDYFCDYFHAASFAGLPHILSRFSMQDIAAAAKPVMERAESGDPFCAGIVGQASRLVANTAFSVFRKLDFAGERAVDVVTVGSLFKSSMFAGCFKKELRAMAPQDNFHFCGEVASPVLGGVALAKILFP